ncbi:MAG TPA: IclR family transcriptional regulator [Steroidobacter sp.]
MDEPRKLTSNRSGSRKVVKSAARTLDVLELFQRKRRALSAAAICQALGYPKSSANVLLRSLVSQGYLVLNARTMQYFPSLRVTRLGEWIPRTMLVSGRVSAILEDVHAVTQETVTLSVVSDLSTTFLKVIQGTHPLSMQTPEGFVAPLFTTAIGMAILSQMPDEDIDELVDRANFRSRRREEQVNRKVLDAAIQETREKGYCVRYDAVIPDTGAIGVPFPSDVDGFPMALGIGGLASRIERNERAIYKHVRACLARHDRGRKIQ